MGGFYFYYCYYHHCFWNQLKPNLNQTARIHPLVTRNVAGPIKKVTSITDHGILRQTDRTGGGGGWCIHNKIQRSSGCYLFFGRPDRFPSCLAMADGGRRIVQLGIVGDLENCGSVSFFECKEDPFVTFSRFFRHPFPFSPSPFFWGALSFVWFVPLNSPKVYHIRSQSIQATVRSVH